MGKTVRCDFEQLFLAYFDLKARLLENFVKNTYFLKFLLLTKSFDFAIFLFQSIGFENGGIELVLFAFNDDLIKAIFRHDETVRILYVISINSVKPDK